MGVSGRSGVLGAGVDGAGESCKSSCGVRGVCGVECGSCLGVGACRRSSLPRSVESSNRALLLVFVKNSIIFAFVS